MLDFNIPNTEENRVVTENDQKACLNYSSVNNMENWNIMLEDMEDYDFSKSKIKLHLCSQMHFYQIDRRKASHGQYTFSNALGLF